MYLACILLPVVTAGAWEVVEHDERDYVTFDSMAEFYGFKHDVDGRHLWLRGNRIVIKGIVGSQDLLINQIKFVLSYPVIQRDDRYLVSRLDLCKLIDPVIRPHFIKDASPFRTVIVDPGHGGQDAGAGGSYGNEKEFTLRLARQLKRNLEDRGFRVEMTREDDRYLTLAERVAIANRVEKGIFVSLHFNSGSNAASGIETFALSPYGAESTLVGPANSDFRNFRGNQRDTENIALATAVHVASIKSSKSVDRGIKRARWAVLREINKPAILFEGGFITHEEESRKIASATHRETLANSIAEGISNFRNALTKK